MKGSYNESIINIHLRLLVSNVTLLLNISYKAEISIKGEEGKYNIGGCFEKTEKYHSEPTDHVYRKKRNHSK